MPSGIRYRLRPAKSAGSKSSASMKCSRHKAAIGGRPESIELVIVDDHVLVGSIGIAADDCTRIHGAVQRTLLDVADALAAVGV